MKLKTNYVIIATVIVCIVLLSGFFVYKAFPLSAENEWQRICQRVEAGQVLESKALLNNEIFSIDVGCLSEDDFKIEHPKDRSPPTPYYGTIEITFHDGEVISLYNWETEYFSVYYSNRYYEVANEELFLQLKSLHTFKAQAIAESKHIAGEGLKLHSFVISWIN